MINLARGKYNQLIYREKWYHKHVANYYGKILVVKLAVYFPMSGKTGLDASKVWNDYEFKNSNKNS